MKILERYKTAARANAGDVITLEEYLKAAKKDKSFYSSPAERLLTAIGKAQVLDTSDDPRKARIFENRTIRLYDVFKEIYGLEDVLEQIVAFFRHASQGLEEKNQVLCLRGPVGSAKSTIVELLKALMESEPFYALQGSPMFESPLGLFVPEDSKELGIPPTALETIPSPWALKRVEEYNGDLSKFNVVKLYPSRYHQIAIAKVEPGDENTQDISSLTGKISLRKLSQYDQNDPDAYSYSGGLCRANRGFLDYVEMLKSSREILHPLLTATQEHNYTGTEAIGPIPFDGIIMAHFNETEWGKFANDKKNEAFFDRFSIIDVPYNLRKSEEVKIYKKLIDKSSLVDAPLAPHTLEALAEFAIYTKLDDCENSTIRAKANAYDGLAEYTKDPSAKTLREYKDAASDSEGFKGLSTRDTYKILSETYNYSPHEIAADPVHLFVAIDNYLDREKVQGDERELYDSYLRDYVKPRFYKNLGKDIQKAFFDYYDSWAQNYFENYFNKADTWIQNRDYKDPDTGQLIDSAMINEQLEKLEKAAGITNAKDFRSEIVTYVLRTRKVKGETYTMPRWNAYGKIRVAIEKVLANKTEDLLPVISFDGKRDKEYKEKHNAFVKRMMDQGYTKRQVQRLVQAYIEHSKTSE